MIVGISGYARAGKDTIGEILVRKHGFERRAFADKLREAALALDPIVTDFGTSLPRRLSHVVEKYGWEDAKSIEEVRRTLQRMGTEVGRDTLDPDVWVTALQRTLELDRWGGIQKHYVITDVRFENEARWVCRMKGVMVRVERPGVGPANDHISETGLDDFEFGATINNSGSIEDLEHKVAYYVKRYWVG